MASEFVTRALDRRDRDRDLLPVKTPSIVTDLPSPAQRILDENRSRLSSTLTAVSGGNPATLAKLRQDAARAGLDERVAARNPQALQQSLAKREANILAGQKDTPATKRVFQNPSFAAVASDRVGPLSELERRVRKVGLSQKGGEFPDVGEILNRPFAGTVPTAAAGATQATLGISESIYRTPESAGRISEHLAQSLEAATGLPRALNPIRAAQYTAEFLAKGQVPGTDIRTGGMSDIADRIGESQKILTQEFETFKRLTEKGELAGKAFSAAAEGNLDPLITTLRDPEAWAGFIGQAAPSLYAAFKSGGALPFMAWLEGMEVATDAADFEKRTGQKVSPADFANATAQAATINAFLEKFGLDKIFKAGRGGTLFEIIKGALAEGGTEGLQALNTNVAVKATYDPSRELTEGVLPGIMGGTGVGGPMRGVVSVAERRVRLEQIKLEEVRMDALKAQEAMVLAAEMEALGEQVKAEELQGRDPAAFNEFVEEATKDGADTIYIEAAKFNEVLEQSGLDPEEVMAELPSVAEQYTDALATGGDIQIPLGEYITKIAATDYHAELSRHARLRPEGMSPAEAAAWQETALSEFEQRAREGAEKEALDKEVAPARQVYERIREQLSAIEQPDAPRTGIFGRKGKLSQKTIEGYARLHQAVAASLISRGVDPMRYYGGLFVQGEAPATDGAQFDAALQQPPAFIDAPLLFSAARDKFLSVLPEDANFEELAESVAAGDFSPEYRNLINALERDEWLGFDSPAAAINAVFSEDVERFEPSQGLKQALGRVVNNEATLRQEPIDTTIGGIEVGEITDAQEQQRIIEQYRARVAGRPARESEIAGTTLTGEPARDGWDRATRVTRGGRPATVFRGSRRGVSPDSFVTLGANTAIPASGLGVFFSSSETEAQGYGDRVSEVFLDIRNPKVYTLEALKALTAEGHFETVDTAMLLSESLRIEGHDGIAIDARADGGPVHFIAFEPDQVIPAETISDAELFQEAPIEFDPDAIEENMAAIETRARENFNLEEGEEIADYQLEDAVAEVMTELQPTTLEQAALHGTPHTFDKFSLDAIGSGEGAQAYGWGLYFAEDKAVAEYYRDNLTNDTTIDDIRARNDAEEYVIEKIKDYREEVDASPDKDAIGDWMRSDRDAEGYYYGVIGDYLSPSDIDEAVDSVYSQLPAGSLYQVDIPEDSELLDWDKPLNEQPESVQDALFKARKVRAGERSTLEWAGNGSKIYQDMSNILGGDKAASNYLNSLGIPGLRYLDGPSRGTDGDRHNYVIWDEDTVTIEAVNDEKRQAALEQRKGKAPRGKIGFAPDITEGPTVISLLEGADLSTFQNWAGGPDVPVVESEDVNDFNFTGEGPFIVKVFHGTTHEFNEFDATRGNFEGHFGAVNYFTSSEDDATQNYAGEGPDLMQRIDQRIEQVKDEIDGYDVDSLEDDFGVSREEAEAIDDGDIDVIEEVAKRIARDELSGGQDQTLELYVKMEKPFVVGGETQWIEFVDDAEVYNLAVEAVAENNDLTPEEVREREDDFEDEIDEARWEVEADSKHPLAEAIRVVADRNDIDASELASDVYELDSEARSDDIEKLMRESESTMYAEGPEGEIIGYHLIGEIIEEMGYDSIILKNAEQRFEAMDIESGTAHVHVFHANRSNIKSVENVGTFDPTTGDIFRQQNGKAPRGTFKFVAEDLTAPKVISLLEGADLSTFLHESGHFFFEVWRDIANQGDVDPSFTEDMDTLMGFVGAKSIEDWNGRTLKERRDGHEKFARAFETYLFEGKAPTPKLRKLFETFAAWLRKVYASLKSLDVELTDDVRAVFDRMVASDEQIAIAEANQNAQPLFTTAEEAGMTEEEFAEYQTTTIAAHEDAVQELEARSIRDMKWLSGAKNRVLKQLQSKANSKRNAIRKEVEAEVAAEPVYRAMNFFKRGELTNENGETSTTDDNHRLDIDALGAMYEGQEDAPDWTVLGYGAYGILGKDGVHPDMAAEWFGFSSGDEMVEAMLEARPMDEVITGMTDQRMIEENADLVDAQAIDAAANEALHNEARQRMVATELKAISKLAAIRAIDRQQAKEYAIAAVEKLRVRDIQPSRFETAERRAAKTSTQEMAKGETLNAARAKQDQFLNGQLAREAHKGKADVDKILSYFKKLNSKAARKNIDPSYMDQIDQILVRFDLRSSVSLKAIDKRTALADWIAKQEEMGLNPIIDERLLDETRREHYKNLPLGDLRELRDSVKNIEHLGRLKQKLLTARDKREFAEIVTRIDESIRENATRTIVRDIETRTPAEDDKEFLGSWFAAHRKLGSYAREMDGSKDAGMMWEYFIRPMNERGDLEAVEREKATIRFSELFEQYTSFQEALKQSVTNITRGKFEAAKPAMQIKQYIPEIGRSLSKMGRIVVALNCGNNDNRDRIMESYGWNDSQVQAILNTLEQDDWTFVQGVWDFIDEYWSDIKAKEERVTGVAPKKVEAVPVLTKFGEFKGGYYPIKYDHRQSPQTVAHLAEDAAKMALQGAFSRRTTKRGHTKERTGSGGQKVRLDFGVMFEHVDQVIHDLAWHEWLIDANRLLGSNKVQEAIYDHYGGATYSTMKKAVEDIAAGDVPAELAFERSINWVRTGTSIAGMGWSLWTSLLQPFGLTQGMVRIGPKWVGRGMAKWMGNAARMEETVASIHERSAFMRLRWKTMQREINEIQNKVMAGGVMTKVQDSFFYLIVKAQMVADVPIWLGQYEKSISENMTEKDAIAQADQAVLDSQGGGQVKDLAQIQRGGPLLKLWTNFYSYFNTTFNLTAESYRRNNLKKPKEMGRFMVDMLLLYWLPATMSALMREAVKGECGDDDIGCLAENITRENLSYMAGTMVGVREMSGFLNGFYGYQGPAGTRFFSEATKLGVQASQGEVDKAMLKALNNTAGILFHYPAAQVQRTADGLAAIADGDTNSPLAPMFGPPKN